MVKGWWIIKDVFFYCVDTSKFDNYYYIVMGGNTNSIFMYTINNDSEFQENIEALTLENIYNIHWQEKCLVPLDMLLIMLLGV